MAIPIATLTLNPALDVTYDVQALEPDHKCHALHVSHHPGGNGINVGRALRVLGVAASNVAILAGDVGRMVAGLCEQELEDPHFLMTEGQTRINCTCLDLDNRLQYEVTGIGPVVAPQLLHETVAVFLERARGGIGILTGSVPPGVPATIYAEMTSLLHRAGAKAVVDAHGELLHAALEQQPFLIKPNRYELELLCGRKLPTIQDVAREAMAIRERGVEMVCVSLGAEGALLATASGVWHGQAVPVPVRCTVGAGDSMVAGLVAGLATHQDAAQTLRLGLVMGAGTAAKPGTGLATREDLDALLPMTEIKEMAS